MSRKESALEPCSESAFANTWGAGLLPRHTGAASHCPRVCASRHAGRSILAVCWTGGRDRQTPAMLKFAKH